MPAFGLPPKNKGTANVVFEDVRSIVIVGANGSGKTRMGVWIEERAGALAHRLTAQRALTIPLSVAPQPYEQAEAAFLFGGYHPGHTAEQRAGMKFQTRWGNEPAIRMLSDYEQLLALLFADEAKRDHVYSRAALTELPKQRPPECKIDRLLEIWRAVMPQRALSISDNKIETQTGHGASYKAQEMSDGERVALYLIGQSLCAPVGAIVIVDEPEIHVHRALQGQLWDKIEEARSDCAFVYITHDLEFAATRTSATKIWLKEFDGNDWVWEELPKGSALPDALLFQVLGSRRPLLFVEGDESSHDAAIYTSLYAKELVVPRQTCEKVVEATRAMRALYSLHSHSVRGIVDRDRRGDEEINALRAAGLLVADVAEVENLLCLPEAVSAVAEQLKIADATAALDSAGRSVLAELQKEIDHQALAHALAEIQFRLNGFGPKIGNSDAAKLELDLESYVAGINVSATIKKQRERLAAVVETKDYRGALRLYNCKGIIAFVASSLGIKKDVYCRIVLELIKGKPNGTIANAMRKAIEEPTVPIAVTDKSDGFVSVAVA